MVVPALILWLSGALVGLLVVLAVAFYAPPALQHRRHVRTLANIARLERELDVGGHLTEAKLADAIAVADRAWELPEPAQRIYGDCLLCGRRVALNAGRCRGVPLGCAACAKETYWKSLRPPSASA
jgi:hypothetical protein